MLRHIYVEISFVVAVVVVGVAALAVVVVAVAVAVVAAAAGGKRFPNSIYTNSRSTAPGGCYWYT